MSEKKILTSIEMAGALAHSLDREDFRQLAHMLDSRDSEELKLEVIRLARIYFPGEYFETREEMPELLSFQIVSKMFQEGFVLQTISAGKGCLGELKPGRIRLYNKQTGKEEFYRFPLSAIQLMEQEGVITEIEETRQVCDGGTIISEYDLTSRHRRTNIG
jgi:hypothetical protein